MQTPPHHHFESHPMRLLVAEDEPIIGIYLQQGLSDAGVNVDRFTNGTVAL